MDLVENFLALEQRHRLNQLEIEGYLPWVYSRFSLWEQLNALAVGEGAAPPHKSGRARRMLVFACRALFGDPLRAAKPADICFLAHPRRVLVKGMYKDIYTDDLARHYENSITMERLESVRHYTPAFTKNLRYNDRFVLKGALAGRLAAALRGKHYQSVAAQMEAAFGEPLRQLAKQAGVALDVPRTLRWMTLRYYSWRALKKGYAAFLDKVRPKLIVEVVSYSIDCMVFNELGKERGIPCLELQHGTMGKGHIAYNYPKGTGISPFPDKVLLFSDYWKNARFPIAPENLIAQGFPYFEQQLPKYTSQHPQSQREKNILFLSQPLWNGALGQLALELSEAGRRQGWKVVFKLHPKEYGNWRQRYPMLAGSGVEVVGAGGPPLYELFAVCGAQVGVHSTALYEGLGFGLRTFVVDLPGSQRMADLYGAGYAILVSGCRQLYDELQRPAEPAGSSRLFWKPNALANIEQTLDALL